MSNSHKTQVTQFCLEGRFLDFVIKDGYKLKGLNLATSEGECYVKLAKHLRAAFDWRLPQGTWLQIVGEKKHDIKTGEVKLIAEQVMAAKKESGRRGEGSQRVALVPKVVATGVEMGREIPTPSFPSTNNAKAKPAAKGTILVCQKSDCMKRGAKGLCQAMEAALSDRGLEDQVTIKGTGCMKNCKAGPNLVMPDKTRYTRIQAAQVPALMDKHFADNPNSQEATPIAGVASV